MRPNDLAAQLGISPKTLRAWLRRTYPRSPDEHNTEWYLTPDQVAAAEARFGGSGRGAATGSRAPAAIPRAPREREPRRLVSAASDEAYVIDLCDEILDQAALRQHRFDFLLGDPGKSGSRARLPVDAYYPSLNLVVEYRERQHTEAVPFFDRRQTVSGIGRGEQRRLYDKRREEELPKHDIRLIVISCDDLDVDARGRLRRNREFDGSVIRGLISESTEGTPKH